MRAARFRWPVKVLCAYGSCNGNGNGSTHSGYGYGYGTATARLRQHGYGSVQPQDADDARVVLVGLPDDEPVVLPVADSDAPQPTAE